MYVYLFFIGKHCPAHLPQMEALLRLRWTCTQHPHLPPALLGLCLRPPFRGVKRTASTGSVLVDTIRTNISRKQDEKNSNMREKCETVVFVLKLSVSSVRVVFVNVC